MTYSVNEMSGSSPSEDSAFQLPVYCQTRRLCATNSLLKSWQRHEPGAVLGSGLISIDIDKYNSVSVSRPAEKLYVHLPKWTTHGHGCSITIGNDTRSLANVEPKAIVIITTSQWQVGHYTNPAQPSPFGPPAIAASWIVRVFDATGGSLIAQATFSGSPPSRTLSHGAETGHQGASWQYRKWLEARISQQTRTFAPPFFIDD
jgi:hypothetical protein